MTYRVSARQNTFVTCANGTVNIPAGYAVIVNAVGMFEYNALKDALSRSLNQPVACISICGDWDWKEM